MQLIRTRHTNLTFVALALLFCRAVRFGTGQWCDSGQGDRFRRQSGYWERSWRSKARMGIRTSRLQTARAHFRWDPCRQAVTA